MKADQEVWYEALNDITVLRMSVAQPLPLFWRRFFDDLAVSFS